MKLRAFAIAAFLFAIGSGAASAGGSRGTQENRGAAGGTALSDLVIFNERTGEVFDLKRQPPPSIDNLIRNDAGGRTAAVPICPVIFAYCLSLTSEDRPEGDESSWPALDCLCSSGCLTQEAYDSLCNYGYDP